MELQGFGIDGRLAGAIDPARAAFHEKMLVHAVQKGENVCAKMSLSEGREEICLLPALQWLAGAPVDEHRRILVVVPDETAMTGYAAAASALAAAIEAKVCVAKDEGLEGEAESGIVIGTPASLLSAAGGGLLKLRAFGYLVVDGAEKLGELPSEVMRKLGGSLLPSWERRTILGCARITVKAKNLAWDLADNPSEIGIEETAVKAQGVPNETWHVASDQKFRFLLSLIERDKPGRICVFCNLKDTAAEVAKRLQANDKSADYILGSLPIDRKLAILERAKSGELLALVLTDQGAEGLAPSSFPFLVNYDIPLEPEYYVKRLAMLDRNAPVVKLVNIACDRYVYGLTAVEQYIDAKLNSVVVDSASLTVEDKSAGMVFERPRRFDRDGPREAPRGAPLGAPLGEGSGDRRGDRDRQSSRGGYRGDRRFEHDDRRPRNDRQSAGRDDRSPDIKRGIADATGGSIDMDGPAPGGETARQQGQDRREQAQRRDGRRGPSRPEGGPSRRRDEARPDGRHEARPDSRHEARSGNPYDLPMEERMKQYREKYGRRVGGESAGAPKGGAPRSRGDRGDGQRQRPREGSRERDVDRRGQEFQKGAAPRNAAPREARQAPVERHEGIFGKIAKFFKKDT
jgi:ATP-dependent RNA helicase RhlB